MRLVEIGSWLAVCIDNPFRQQVPDFLPVLRLVSRKDVIEAPVFTDDYDHMLDGRPGIAVAVLITVIESAKAPPIENCNIAIDVKPIRRYFMDREATCLNDIHPPLKLSGDFQLQAVSIGLPLLQPDCFDVNEKTRRVNLRASNMRLDRIESVADRFGRAVRRVLRGDELSAVSTYFNVGSIQRMPDALRS